MADDPLRPPVWTYDASWMTLPDIVVLSAAKAKRFQCERPWAAIQVTGSFDGEPQWPSLSRRNCLAQLKLDFPDCDDPRDGPLFTDADADRVLTFAAATFPRIKVLMVHCLAGVSRSVAIAAALTKVCGGDDAAYFSHFIPNRHVYRTIIDRAQLNPELPHE